MNITSSIKKIKKRFKNAKEVRSVNGHIFDYTKSKNIHECSGHIYINDANGGVRTLLYNGIKGKEYAEIISYKEPIYQLTTKEVVHAYENPQWLKDTFKECFETELEVWKWYNWKNKDLLFCVREIQVDEIYYFGFEHDEYTDNDWIHKDNDFEPATEKEVEEALKNQSIKNGNVFCNWKFENNILYGTDCCLNISGVKWTKLFDNGFWLDLTPTYTIPEAESKFKIKIINPNV